ncbi:MAG: hypothetical protein JST12_05820 [Armatimonadetes bacterium]|nr:hypothetical protein [Armatimonadota bacterium]
MSFDIPASIEPRVQQYAASLHITADEAILRLLQVGLDHASSSSPKDIVGAFSTANEVEVMDQALNLAMEDRVRRNS